MSPHIVEIATFSPTIGPLAPLPVPEIKVFSTKQIPVKLIKHVFRHFPKFLFISELFRGVQTFEILCISPFHEISSNHLLQKMF